MWTIKQSFPMDGGLCKLLPTRPVDWTLECIALELAAIRKTIQEVTDSLREVHNDDYASRRYYVTDWHRPCCAPRSIQTTLR
ncbi:UNVERIFIED_ORG: hypothetical protein J3D58_002259 [Paenarthrobacter nicotinovorans]